MIELVFVACLTASPATCEEHGLLYQDLSPHTCVMGAQPALADWIAGHPDYRIARWTCRPVTGERDA